MPKLGVNARISDIAPGRIVSTAGIAAASTAASVTASPIKRVSPEMMPVSAESPESTVPKMNPMPGPAALRAVPSHTWDLGAVSTVQLMAALVTRPANTP